MVAVWGLYIGVDSNLSFAERINAKEIICTILMTTEYK